MEINLNCDLGEKSIHYDGKNDLQLLKIINSANIACGFHAGNKSTIDQTIKIAKKNNVSIGAHPGFKDLKNFGRKKINISEIELIKLITKQLEIIDKIANQNMLNITHVKLHGALNNIACENLDIAMIIAKTIKKFKQNLIYVILPLTQMERSAQKTNIKYACEIYADRNYKDNGQLIDRNNRNALINDPIKCRENIIEMLETSSIKTINAKKLKCEIDTICIHSDGNNSVKIAKNIKNELLIKGYKILNLNNMSKFK